MKRQPDRNNDLTYLRKVRGWRNLRNEKRDMTRDHERDGILKPGGDPHAGEEKPERVYPPSIRSHFAAGTWLGLVAGTHGAEGGLVPPGPLGWFPTMSSDAD